jgi:putative PIN family toxin of toxin-antitoxin system
MRVVLDTNVVVSGYLAPTGTPAAVLSLWERGVFDLVVSAEIVAEYERVLREPDIRRLHHKTDSEIDAVIQRIRQAALQAVPAQRLAVVAADSDDDKILECAVAGNADHIVSGDKHLLALGSYQEIQILPPAVFVRLFATDEPVEPRKESQTVQKGQKVMTHDRSDATDDDQQVDVTTWQESDSARFIDLGRIYTPRRDELRDAFLDLIPAEAGDRFTGVEIGTGQGWLTEAILRRFSAARMIGLDGSETMLRATEATLAPYPGRFEVRAFRLEDAGWVEGLPGGLCCVVSSLVIHHLHGPEKAALFRALYGKLAAGGALLIADVMESTSAWGRRHMANAWNAEVEYQSIEYGGDRRAYDQFVADHWNMYEYPLEEDDIDHPSALPEQLAWMVEAGFEGVDAFWVRAGHALFGGYKPR